MPFCGTAEAGAQVALSGPQTRSDRLVRRVPLKVLKSMLKSGLIRFEPRRPCQPLTRKRSPSARPVDTMLTQGRVEKVALAFPHRFWPQSPSG